MKYNKEKNIAVKYMYIKYNAKEPKNREIDKHIWQNYKLTLHQGKRKKKKKKENNNNSYKKQWYLQHKNSDKQ